MRHKDLGLNLLLALSSVLLFVGGIEGGLRLAHFEYSPLKVVEHSDFRGTHMFRDKLKTIYDPYLLWKPNPAITEVFNSAGFRGPELTENKPEGTYRIFAIGDSNTMGSMTGIRPHWPGFLDELLQASPDGRHFEVINAGVLGYTSFQGLRRFQQVLKYNPDLVMVSFGSNDAFKVLIPDKHYQTLSQSMTRLREVLLKTRTYQLMLAAAGWLQGRRGAQALSPRVSLEDYRLNLIRIITTVREHHISVILLTRPFIGESTDPLGWKVDGPKYNAMTLEVAKEYQVPAIDVYTLFKDKPYLFWDESHFTAQGYARMAAVIYNFLVQEGLAQGEPFTLRSSVQIGTVDVYQLCQLGEGWHEVENWPPAIRWTKDRAVTYLRGSPSQHTLIIRVYVHRSTSGQIAVNGQAVKKFSLDPGWHELTSPVPEAEDATVEVEVSVNNPWIPPSDGRLLGVAVEKMALE